MAIDVGVPRSRRAVLAAALGGLAASAAHALGRPTAALATDGQPVVQGADNSGSASTLVRSSTTTAFQGLADAASGTAYGVRGRSNSTGGAGVVGQVVALTGTNYGVRGIASSTTGGVGVRGEAPLRGVEGIATATDGGAVGVRAVTNSATGFGLAAENTEIADDATAIGCQAHGVAIYALATGVVGKGLAAVANSATGETVGVDGKVVSPNGMGVRGWSENPTISARGVFGTAPSGTGVHGWAGSSAAPLPTAKSGVFGQCDSDSSSNGVFGRSSVGYGVRGLSSTGIGLFGQATGATGTALKVSGKAVFTRSGKATVPNGSSSVLEPSVTLTSSSLVIATIQGSAASGVYVRYVAPSIANSNFTIKLSKVVTADTKVGWFIVN